MSYEIDLLRRKIEDLKAENLRLRQSENEAVYRSLFENNHAVMLLIDPETAAIKDANPAACSYYGWSREELKALRIDEINTLTKNEVFAQMQLARAEKRRNFFFKHRRADGTVRDVEVYSGPLTVRGQTLLYSIVHDITERKQVEDALRESENKYSQLVESLTDAILVWSREDIVYANPAALKLFRANQPGDLIGKRYLDLVHPDDRPESAERIKKSKNDKWIAPRREHRMVTADGQLVHVESTGVPIQSRGRILHFGIFCDISERKRIENELRESEECLRIANDAARIGTYTADLEADEVYWSPELCDILGVQAGIHRTHEEAYGIVHKDDLLGVLDINRRSKESDVDGRFTSEHRVVRPDGQVRWVLWRGRTIFRETDSGKIPSKRIGACVDITERKQAEDALRESEAIFSSFMEHCPVYVFFKDATSRSIRLSRNYEQMLGRPIEGLLGKTMDELFPSELAKGMIEDDLRVIRDGQPIKVVEELSGRTFETTKFPVLQPGKQPFLAGFTIDITERKRADQQREKLETQLRQAQKMEAIGTLAGGIAHDFNNILSVIIGNAEILEMTDISFSAKDETARILNASKRAKQLVRQILAFSRQGDQQMLLISLKPVVKETLDFLRASIPSTIQLQHRIDPDAGAIMADPTQMQQVLMNLCTNAAHAMEKNGGTLKIELDAVSLADDDIPLDSEAERGQYTRLTISDTGHGIEPRLQQRIFDPYFTTKGPDKGTGLGLSVVHGIVKSHGGIIKVHSEVGKGTAFQVLFPRADGVEKKEEKSVQGIPIGSEKILLIDDELHLAEMYQRMLAMLGYHVDSRTSPVEAVEAVRANPQKYDLVITDMTMPQMTGYNLAKKLMEIRPNLPVVLCTGFSDQINEDKARSVGILAFLLKPVLFHDLAATLRKVLDDAYKKKPT